MTNSQIQVAPTHYDGPTYDTKERWASYWHQIDEVRAVAASSCLEIGTGNGFVKAYLGSRGIDVTSVDFDPALKPDRVGDVRSLPCADAEFDVVICAQVLEHLPFEDLDVAMAELRRVCRRRVIVSIPRSGRFVRIAFRIPPFRSFSWVTVLPGRRAFAFDGQHYWQAGARTSPLHVVRAVIERHFYVRRDYLVTEHPYHHFFVLEPRSA
jgi:SAM-dependent methyltransferase